MYDSVTGRDLFPPGSIGSWDGMQIAYITDPTDSSRLCAKKAVSGQRHAFIDGAKIPDVHRYDQSTDTYGNFNVAIPQQSQTSVPNNFLTNHTLCFSYYPFTVSNSSKRYILETFDSAVRGSAIYGVDIFQISNYLQVVSNGRSGYKTTNFASGLSANKWYEFVINYELIDSSNLEVTVSVYDGGNLIGNVGRNEIGLINYPQKTNSDSRLYFFNSFYGYWNNCPNNQAYLKDILIYENA